MNPIKKLFGRKDAPQQDATPALMVDAWLLGNFGRMSSTDESPTIPVGTTDRHAPAIQRERLENDLHWFRFYVGRVNGDFFHEALMDNEPWPAGLAALEACGWEATDTFCSARLFLLLRASAPPVREAVHAHE